MLNQGVYQGRLTADPELRTTQNQVSFTTFTIACERDFDRQQTDFINCVAWRNTAEFVSKYFRKGNMAIVSGRLQSRKWKDRDNKERTSWEVIADNIYFCESKKDHADDIATPSFEEVNDDGELPF